MRLGPRNALPPNMIGKTGLFIIVSILGVAAPCMAQGFDPRLDGVPFANQPNYVNAGGTCFGMSVTAIANFRARRRGEQRLTGQAAEAQAVATHVYYEDRLKTNVLFRAQYVAARGGGSDLAGTAARLRQAIASGGPQVIILEGYGLNHAVVAFAASGNSFSIYDPDKPGETRTLRLDDGAWTGSWPRLTRVFIAPQLDEFLAQARTLKASCRDLGDQCAAQFWTVNATIERRGDSAVVTGTVRSARQDAGIMAWHPEYVIAQVDGRFAGRIAIPRDRPFELTLPADARGQVRLLAFVGMRGINLAGFSTETLTIPPVATRGMLGAIGSR